MTTLIDKAVTTAVKLEKKKTHQVYKLASGKRVPGASTVAKLGDDPSALIHWAWDLGSQGLDYRKVRDNAADVGTLAHFMIEAHLNNQTPDLSECSPADIDKATNAFLKFLEFWEGEGLTSISPEVQLVSEEWGYGGTLDAPAIDRNGNYVLLDWKTSKGIYTGYLSQLAAYEALWNENFPDKKITRRAIVRIGKEEIGDFEIRWLPEMDKYFRLFTAQLNLYRAKQEVGK